MSTNASITIRPAELADVPAITEIYNEAILTTTATFDTEPKSVEERTGWLESHGERHPVLVAEVEGKVVGWSSLTRWSDRSAYDDTAETSFYVHSVHRGHGVGRRLKEAIIDEARRLGFHTLIARVAGGSEESIHLNQSAGFAFVGTLKEVGAKFGRVIDVHIFQKLLEAAPVTVTAEDPRAETAARLIGELCAELSARYDNPPSPFHAEEAMEPRAIFLVARLGAQPVGCVALRRIDDATAEIKRMYVAPGGRRQGIARRILSELERYAAGFGYQAIRLETGDQQAEAIGLDDLAGYARIAPFGAYIGCPYSLCYEKRLGNQAGPWIAPFVEAEHRDQVVTLWRTVFGYESAHNDPRLAIEKKMEMRDELFFVALAGTEVIGSIMSGYDGHRGWIYSLAVAPPHRHQGVGSRLVAHAERALSRKGCVKINLQILEGNEDVVNFYESLGFAVEKRISMGKRLVENIPESVGGGR